MPGTILVSVLELLGLPFSSPPSISIKISLGNKEYRTWDKGDFSFPLTTLRETLFVIVQDAEGNEISRGGIESKSIVERGLWDDIFQLEGGGQVRMKLQFILNQDEKNRIRLMRESAIKRKQSGSIDYRTSTVEVAGKNEESASSTSPSSQRVDTQLSSIRPQESVDISWPQSVNNQSSKSGTQESFAIPLPQRFNNQPSEARSQESVSISSPQRFDNQPSKAHSQETVAIPSPQRFDTQPSKAHSQESVAIPSPQRFDTLPSKAYSQESVAIPSPQRFDTQPSKARSQESVAVPLPQRFNTQPSKARSQESVAISSPLRFDTQPSEARSRESAPIQSPQRFDNQPSNAHAQSLGKVVANSLPNEIPSKQYQLQQSLPGIRGSESRGSSSKKRASLERSPSSVKRMISAFENNVPQDIRPEIKPRLEKQEVNKVGLESKRTKTESSKTVQITGKIEELSTTNLREEGIDISSNGSLKLVLKKLDKKETTNPLEYRKQINNVLSNFNQDDDCASVFEESQSEILPRSSESSTIGRNSTDCYEYIASNWFEISSTWIFPDQQRVLCVTAGGKKVMDLMEKLGINSDSHEKHSDRTSMPKSQEVESSSGLFGQIMKVAIMVGFGVLVLFTRQRTNR